MSTGIGRSSWSSSRGATDRIAARPRPIPFGRSATRGHLLGELEVGVCAGAVRVVVDNGLAKARRLPDPDVAGDDRIEHQFGEVLADLPLDILREAGSGVMHRQQHPGHSKPWIELALYERERVEQAGEALQREVLGLYRDDHPIGRYERVDSQRAEGRGP